MKRYYLGFLLVLVVALAAVVFLGANFIKTYISELSNKFQNTTNEAISAPVLSGNYQYLIKNGIQIQVGKFDINVFKSPSDKLFTSQEVALQNLDQVVVNGGYFTETKDYIGLLWNGNERLGRISVGNQQATHIAHFDKQTGRLEFLSSLDFTDSDFNQDTNNIYFQTGPLIIDHNEVQTSLIDRSINGNQSALRSFIGYTESGKIFVGVTTQGYDLRNLGEMLLSKDFFEGETISVINLDGGSSTSIYSSENAEEMSFRDFKELPYFVEFK